MKQNCFHRFGLSGPPFKYSLREDPEAETSRSLFKAGLRQRIKLIGPGRKEQKNMTGYSGSTGILEDTSLKQVNNDRR